MTINSKKKNWNPFENCQMHALKMFWNVCIWHGVVDLIFCGQSTNLHARSRQNGPEHVTKNLARMISYIHFTSEHKQYCHVGKYCTTMQIRTFSRLWLFRRSWKTRTRLQVEPWCIFGIHTFLPISWMCKKQTCVSHSVNRVWDYLSVCRLDGIPARHLWDLFIDVMHSKSKQKHNNQLARWNPLHGKASENRLNSQFLKDILNCLMSVLFLQSRILLIKELCCAFLKTTKLWSRWSSKTEVLQ